MGAIRGHDHRFGEGHGPQVLQPTALRREGNGEPLPPQRNAGFLATVSAGHWGTGSGAADAVDEGRQVGAARTGVRLAPHLFVTGTSQQKGEKRID